MPRVKLISDDAVFAAVRRLLADHGDKAASFAAVSRATGLAAATLVQRFGSQEAMVRAALGAFWSELEARTDAAEAGADLSPKGALALLKALAAEAPETQDLGLLSASLRDLTLRQRATQWRLQVQNALALRFGGGSKGQETAAIVFATWQGQMLWEIAAGKGFKLKEAVKKLT
jgi:AcrR family transcriptional regulator